MQRIGAYVAKSFQRVRMPDIFEVTMPGLFLDVEPVYCLGGALTRLLR